MKAPFLERASVAADAPPRDDPAHFVQGQRLAEDEAGKMAFDDAMLLAVQLNRQLVPEMSAELREICARGPVWAHGDLEPA